LFLIPGLFQVIEASQPIKVSYIPERNFCMFLKEVSGQSQLKSNITVSGMTGVPSLGQFPQ